MSRARLCAHATDQPSAWRIAVPLGPGEAEGDSQQKTSSREWERKHIDQRLWTWFEKEVHFPVIGEQLHAVVVEALAPGGSAGVLGQDPPAAAPQALGGGKLPEPTPGGKNP
eukprot:CAMPEP_0182886800 /NCGR_PEP_ID=MMETSP0034_2-20130328/20439_1 /TAXON_ID=156128 /ORGANISM="Nephroselmis pyriformis, Strain CCMP717" /LENGTH=111 /DNA_ID=CAMNT_0025020137 /DNA_START=114 /DNA_END=446 /DNA_ORIENTATION=+